MSEKASYFSHVKRRKTLRASRWRIREAVKRIDVLCGSARTMVLLVTYIHPTRRTD